MQMDPHLFLYVMLNIIYIDIINIILLSKGIKLLHSGVCVCVRQV